MFTNLNLEPSQLHPNSFAFMRMFKIVCGFLGIGATMLLFFRCFKIQRQSDDGRHSWVSFKNVDHKLFKMFMDFFKDFKDKYYLIHLESEKAYNFVLRLVTGIDEDGRMILDENGKVKTKLVSLFPFR